MGGRVDYREGKSGLETLEEKKGKVMGVCATFNEKYLCCRVHVIKTIQNCPFDCTYCFLQQYLNDHKTKVITDIDSIIEEVLEKTSRQPWRLFRIGTWELGDSLALERVFPQASLLIERFADIPNAVLELKTKSAVVDPILRVRHKGKTVVSWSINTERIIETEEKATASLKQRLRAMKAVVDAGYLLGLHFDPMILYDDWTEDYRHLVQEIFSTVPQERVVWVSIGSLRFSPEMKRLIEINHPSTKITLSEMVTGDDGKMRYVKPLRVQMYRLLYEELMKYLSGNSIVYLCMERWDVWDRVFGYYPESIGHLDWIFASSLYSRFSLGVEKPEREKYEKVPHFSGELPM
jgi:spore photoproduct lyase